MFFSQFKKLSFWNKVGVLGSIASIIGLALFFLTPIAHDSQKSSNTQISSNNSSQINNNSGIIILNPNTDKKVEDKKLNFYDDIERNILLFELGQSIYTYGLVSEVLGEDIKQNDKIAANRDMKDMYDRLKINIISDDLSKGGPRLFGQTRIALQSEREREYLDLGMKLASAEGMGYAILNHRDNIDFQKLGDFKIKEMIALISNNLLSIGVDPKIANIDNLASQLIPKTTEDEIVYKENLRNLRATIKSTIRRNHKE